MAGISLDPSSWGGNYDTSSVWGTSLTLGADPSYNTVRTPTTATADGLQLMQPVLTPVQDNQLSGLWDVVGKVTGYLIAKDAAQSGIGQPAQAPVTQGALTQVAVPVPNMSNPKTNSLVTLAVVGGLVYLAMKG